MPGAPPIQANTSGGSGGSTGNTQPFTVPLTVGNLLVLYVFNLTDATTDISAINWSGPASGTFTLTPTSPVTLASRRIWVYTAQITGAATGVAITFGASINTVVAFAEYSGMATAGVLDGEASATGTGTAINSGNITTANANDTLVSGILVTSSGGGTLTAGASYTLRVNNASTSHRAIEDRNVTATGTYAGTATYSSSQTWVAHLMALKQAVATPTVSTPTVDNPAGTYSTSVTVTASCSTVGATMCYRTDGVDPTATTPGTCDGGATTYSAPITLGIGTTTLKIIGSLVGNLNSAVLSQTYVVRAAASFYVSTSGSDAAAGTEAAPWAHAPGMTGVTGVAAATTLLPGDTIRLKCGDTWSATTMTLTAGGSSGNPITLTSYSTGAKPIISATANSPAITLTVANRGYWTIDGLDLRASGIIAAIFMPASIYHNYWGADMLDVPGWIIQNCVSNAAFYLSGPNTTVRSNVLDGTTNSSPPFAGIVLRSAVNTGALVELNEVHHFKDRGIWINRAANNAVVRYNNVHDILLGSDNEGMGINFDGFEIAVTGGQAYGNWIHACAGIGITYENGTGGRAYYNLIHDCAIGGIDAINYASFQTLPSNIEFTYNVIYNVNGGILLYDAQGIKAIGNTIVTGTGANSFGFGIVTLDTNVQNLTLTNNIIAGVWTHPVQVRTSKAIWDQFDYNDIVPTGSEVVWQAGITTSQTLAQLQALGLMTHGITANPQFVAGSGSAYAIAAGSPANASGTNLGSTYQTALKPTTTWPTNIVTGSQASAWDMGAYLQSPTGTGGGDAGGGHGPSAYRIRKRRRENLERQFRD